MNLRSTCHQSYRFFAVALRIAFVPQRVFGFAQAIERAGPLLAVADAARNAGGFIELHGCLFELALLHLEVAQTVQHEDRQQGLLRFARQRQRPRQVIAGIGLAALLARDLGQVVQHMALQVEVSMLGGE